MLNIARRFSHIINLESNKKRKDEWNVPAYRCVIEREKVQPSKSEIQLIITRNKRIEFRRFSKSQRMLLSRGFWSLEARQYVRHLV